MAIVQMVTGSVKYTADKILNTQYGQKINAVITLPDGQEVKLWGKPDDLSLRSLQRNQSVQLLYDGKGYKLIETPVLSHSQNSNSNGNQPTQYTPWTQEEREVLKAKVLDHAALLKHCLITARSEFGELLHTEDCLFKAAKTLYLAAKEQK